MLIRAQGRINGWCIRPFVENF